MATAEDQAARENQLLRAQNQYYKALVQELRAELNHVLARIGGTHDDLRGV